MTSTYNSAGVTMDRYSDILSRSIVLAKEQWTDSVDTSEDEFLGHILRNIALYLGETNEVVQETYDAQSVSNSTGTKLDHNVELVGMTRNSAAYSTVTLTLTSDRATTVPAGTLYKTAADVNFATDTALVFTGAGSSTVTATCNVTGPYEAGAGTITTIVNTVSGITAVTNAAAATPGSNRETDSELKTRHTSITATSGEDDLASIVEAVSAVSGVSKVLAVENDTDAVDADGLPARTIHVITVGGAAADIGAAIDNNKTATVATYGSNTVNVYNTDNGQTKSINYDSAVDLDLYVIVERTKVSGVYPDDGDAQIKANLIAHFADFKIGEDVVYNALFSSIYSVAGIVLNDLFIGTAASPTGTADIAVTNLQIADLIEANITVQDP